ncbi:hypothetical protein [Microbacterium sp. P5_E9]
MAAASEVLVAVCAEAPHLPEKVDEAERKSSAASTVLETKRAERAAAANADPAATADKIAELKRAVDTANAERDAASARYANLRVKRDGVLGTALASAQIIGESADAAIQDARQMVAINGKSEETVALARRANRLATAVQAQSDLATIISSLRALLTVAAVSPGVREWFPVDPEMSAISNTPVVPATMTAPPEEPASPQDPTKESLENLLKKLLAHLAQ